MGKKIFVSYKYSDSSVENLKYGFGLGQYDIYNTTVRDYVTRLEYLISEDNIYKGEHDGEDLSNFTNEYIWSSLKEKIFDSTITIVLISPRMKEEFELERNQWIPQEIAYSLRNKTRNNRQSQPNALIYVVLPDSFGRYNYFINWFGYQRNVIFEIMNRNINNKKYDDGSYAVTVKWEDFIKNPQSYITRAIENQNNIEQYNITTQLWFYFCISLTANVF